MQTVKIRVRKPTRVLTFLSKDVDIQREDKCVIRTDRGLEFGVCVLPPEPCAPADERRYKMQVVRKATPQDESTFYRIQEDERNAGAVCRRKIEERRLAMKLVDTEFTFDKNKVLFYFTAADRVDFRDLVRDLAHELKTRIELRHIQVRDEAKIVGGIGVCGRELCCSTWLREFSPISMKMAKRQNLSLNPSKISGQCGRLLCCLSYENELYQKRKRRDTAEASEAQQAAMAAVGIDPNKQFLAPHEVDALERAANRGPEDQASDDDALGFEIRTPEREPVRTARPQAAKPTAEADTKRKPEAPAREPERAQPVATEASETAKPPEEAPASGDRAPRRRRRRSRGRKGGGSSA